jgi:hypothetical protein
MMRRVDWATFPRTETQNRPHIRKSPRTFHKKTFFECLRALHLLNHPHNTKGFELSTMQMMLYEACRDKNQYFAFVYSALCLKNYAN